MQATLAEYIYNKRTTYLLKKTDSTLLMKDISRPYGFPYAEQLTLMYYTEIYQPFAGVPKSVMRHVNTIQWSSRPWVLASLIERSCMAKLEMTMEQIINVHLPRSNRDYFARQQAERESISKDEVAKVARLPLQPKLIDNQT